MKTEIKRRAVAIVGRPNVGKSSVFNRLGRRIAIVHEERGVTRDRMVQEVEWKGERFDLIDTGGLGRLDFADRGQEVEHRELEENIRRQIEVAVEDACAIILVTDIETGVIPQDEEVVEFLRMSGRPVFLAANKADNQEREGGASDFERFGFPVFPVSALHYRGFETLMAAVIQSLPEVDNPTVEHPLKVTVVGHPNVGKSSFINRLLQCERVIVSDLPGTTRDSIDVPFVVGKGAMARHYVLTDTAGIRHARKLRNAVERLSLSRAERSIARADVAVLVLDAVQGPTTEDKKIASFILHHHKGCVILVNKWDLMGSVTAKQYRNALETTLPFLDFIPVVLGSAKTGFNIRHTIDAIDTVAAHTNAHLPTGVLNRVIIQAYERNQPPLVKGKRLKIYYATQVGSQPVTIALFVNSPDRLASTYESYLMNTLRRAFGLEGAPILLKARGRNERERLHT